MRWSELIKTGAPILAPWNTPDYLAANSFHPLLTGFFKNNTNIVLPDLVKLEENKLLSKNYVDDFFFNKPIDILRKNKTYLPKYILDNYIVLHHTRFPNSDSNFILHFESVSSLAMPYSQTGKKIERSEIRKIRQIFDKHFQNNLKAIITHIDQSVEEFEIIKETLKIEGIKAQKISPLSLYNPTYNKIEKSNNPRIIFTNSKHQNWRNFFSRGGAALINILPHLYSKFPNLEVIILGVDPKALDLNSMEINQDALRFIPRIKWISGFIPEEMINYLIGSSWIYVLPSAHLHTASIIKAYKLGTHVICTEVPGIASILENINNFTLLENTLSNSKRRNLLGMEEVLIEEFAKDQNLIQQQLGEAIIEKLKSPKIKEYNVVNLDLNLDFNIEYEFSNKIENQQKDLTTKANLGLFQEQNSPILLCDFNGWKVYKINDRYITFNEKDKIVRNADKFDLIPPHKFEFLFQRFIRPALIQFIPNKKQKINDLSASKIQQKIVRIASKSSTSEKFVHNNLHLSYSRRIVVRYLRRFLEFSTKIILGAKEASNYVEAIYSWPTKTLIRKSLRKIVRIFSGRK